MTDTELTDTQLIDTLGGTRSQRARWTLGLGALMALAVVVSTISVVPDREATLAAELQAYATANAQSVEVSTADVMAQVEASSAAVREQYEAGPGIATLKAGGTNYDWAKLVLLFAEYPMTDSNVTVMVRWMRQENYVDSWWLRNNPLNNGWGASYGPGGTGSNVNLVEAARNAAEALNEYGRYAGIREAFRTATDAETVERAIWASPWATSHYANGAHWFRTEVDVVTAPASAWG